jgi:hypothetical protein
MHAAAQRRDSPRRDASIHTHADEPTIASTASTAIASTRTTSSRP